ncbi:hypothetical protein [Paenibacillus naphthalenovorans]|uniref:hypothetical protein n=1 Tax=Paenibacillus naphthalenovorans TaxID=162209 RepID=UPI003D2D31EA
MKFFTGNKNGINNKMEIIWDKDKNCELCTFIDGVYETEDEYIIEKLCELGYEYENTESQNTHDEKSIRLKAKELGIKSWHVKNIDTLIAEINEKEGDV